MASVLVVESEIIFGSFLENILREGGHSVEIVTNGNDGWEKLLTGSYDVVVVEVFPEGKKNFDLCKKIKKRFDDDILIILINTLTAIPEMIYHINGHSGKKQIKDVACMASRILKIINDNYEKFLPGQLYCGDINLDVVEKKVYIDGKDISLIRKEFMLLCFFMGNKGRVVSRMSLLKNVWEKNFDTNTNIVDVYVNHLREKVEKSQGKKYIHTVVGIGYIMADETEVLT